MIEYKKTFLSEIKLLLSYFVKFSNNGFILPKIYLNDYIIGGLDQRSLIMIIYDKSTCSANNYCWKV